MTMQEYFESIRGKTVAVVGLGVSNRPLVDLLLQHGCKPVLCDKRGPEQFGEYGERLLAAGCVFHTGETYLENLDCDLIFRTPGLHPRFLQQAVERGSEVTSEMELFFRFCPCRIFAVTGSDGKTTTSTLISELLKAQGYKVWLGGNIGTPLLDKIPLMTKEDMVVLELSSFQLHSMRCRPDCALVTNISPNHLDIHPDYQDYIDAKKQIFLNQTPDGRLVINADNEITRTFAADAPSRPVWFSRTGAVENGVYLRGDEIVSSEAGTEEVVLHREDILIPGLHNVENYMAAYAAVRDLVSPENLRNVARSFPGVPHRLEMIRVLHGVTYCNDSIASSPTRTIAGLNAINVKPILIAGGYDKHVPFTDLGHEICKHVKKLFLCGATAPLIYKAVTESPLYDAGKLPIVELHDFKETVLAASAAAGEGDMVLLSPACASFDQFPNFAVRGDTFREIVNALK